MSKPKPIQLGPVNAGSGFEILAYATKRVGAVAQPITSADVTTISWASYPWESLDADATAVASGTIAVVAGTSVYDTPQSGTIWSKGGPGFNLALAIPAVAIPYGEAMFLIQVTLGLAGRSDPAVLLFLIPALGVPAV